MKRFISKLLVAILLVIYAIPSTAKVLIPREIIISTPIASLTKSASFTSDVYHLRSPHYAVYAKWDETSTLTGSWAGTIRLQASLDGTLWSNIIGTDVTLTSSSSSFWNLGDASYLYGRVQATVTAGSAKVFVKLNRK